MEIEYSLDESDLIALAEYQAKNSPVLRKRFRVQRFTYLIGFSFLAVGAYGLSLSTIITISFAALGVLFFLLYPLYSKWNVQRNIPRIVRNQMRPSSIGKRRLRATAEGLVQISEASQAKIRWGVVDHVIETPGHTFVSIENNLAVIVPRSKLEKSSYEEFMKAFRLYQHNPAAPVNEPYA